MIAPRSLQRGERWRGLHWTALAGLVRLKPFNETAEAAAAGDVYASSGLIGFGIALGAALAVLALGLALFRQPLALMMMIALAVAVSSVVAGFEWHAGLKAGAPIQLSTTVIVATVVALVGNA